MASLEAIERQAQTAAEAARAAHRPADLVEASSNAMAVETVLNATRTTVGALTAELAHLEKQADHEAAVVRLADLSRMLARAQVAYDAELEALPGQIAAILGPAREHWEAWAQLRREVITVLAGAGVRVPSAFEVREHPEVAEPVNAMLREVEGIGGNLPALRLARQHHPPVFFGRSLPLTGNGWPYEAGPTDPLITRLKPHLAPLIEVVLTSRPAPETSRE